MAKNQELKFNFGNDTATQGRNQIRYTAQLNSISNQRATEALRAATKDETLFNEANTALNSGEATDLFAFLESAVGSNIEADAAFMADATEKEFDSMLESRRSDRSKTKAKGLNNSVTIATKYLATGYAEMLVRTAWNKPYDTTASAELDTSDLDAINRKIKSLQSKKSRLTKLVELGDAAAQQAYNDVVDEIDRLASFRPETRTVGKTVIKEADTELIRAALSQVDVSTMDADQAKKLEDLIKKLG